MPGCFVLNEREFRLCKSRIKSLWQWWVVKKATSLHSTTVWFQEFAWHLVRWLIRWSEYLEAEVHFDFFSLGSTLYFKIQEYLKCLHQWILLVLKQNERKEYFFFKIVYEKFVWSFLTYFAFWSFSDQKWIRFSNCSFLKNKDSKRKKFNSELVSILSDEMDIQFLNHKAFLNSSTETVLIFSPGICDLTCFSRKRKTEDSHL